MAQSSFIHLGVFVGVGESLLGWVFVGLGLGLGLGVRGWGLGVGVGVGGGTGVKGNRNAVMPIPIRMPWVNCCAVCNHSYHTCNVELLLKWV